jgi:hypothetical protein
MLSRVGEPVTYHYPEGDRHGVLEDRFVLSVGRNPAGVSYWLIVDKIKFLAFPKHWIRIGYYRQSKDRLVFAGQTTSTFRVSEWKRLFVRAAKEKKWFRELIQDVVDELKK